MENSKFCQSCSMPLDNAALLGTENDGSPSQDYCKFCYQHGTFIHPGFSLDDMKQHMMSLMDKQKMPEDILEAAINRLPNLKRWAGKPARSAH
nr:zinc ribbon domain-containing protein [uncultured Chitinophaga sp.]